MSKSETDKYREIVVVYRYCGNWNDNQIALAEWRVTIAIQSFQARFFAQ